MKPITSLDLEFKMVETHERVCCDIEFQTRNFLIVGILRSNFLVVYFVRDFLEIKCPQNTQYPILWDLDQNYKQMDMGPWEGHSKIIFGSAIVNSCLIAVPKLLLEALQACLIVFYEISSDVSDTLLCYRLVQLTNSLIHMMHQEQALHNILARY